MISLLIGIESVGSRLNRLHINFLGHGMMDFFLEEGSRGFLGVQMSWV